MDLISGYWYILWIGLGGVIGVMLHEFGHVLFCDFVGLKVHKAVYFNNDNSENAPDGYVIHQRPRNLYEATMISIGPLFTTGIIWLFLIRFGYLGVNNWNLWIQLIAYGMFFTIFPSTHDVKCLHYEAKQRINKNFVVSFLYLLIIPLYILSFYLVRIILVVLLMIYLSESGNVGVFDLYGIIFPLL